MLRARPSSTVAAGRTAPDACRLPPDATYSVITHPERFAPLHTVADALLDYLTKQYEAAAIEDPSFAADLMDGQSDVLRAVRIRPQNTSAAPLTLVFTAFPGVVVHAGVLHDFPFPDCGCDACDETVESASDGLEELVMAVAEGRYREAYDEAAVENPPPPGRWSAWAPLPGSEAEPLPKGSGPAPRASYRIVAPDGGFRASGMTLLTGGYPTERLSKAKALLERLDDGWQPWPPRRTHAARHA